MNIKTKLIQKGAAARPGYAMAPKYLTIHNTGNTASTATAASHANYMQNDGGRQEVSYHYVVDDKEIYQILPDNENAWHAGDGASGTGNRHSLAIEICENAGGDLLKATDSAVELTAYLMKKHNIPLSNIVQHNHWSGKDCPNRLRRNQPYSWQTFLNKVQMAYNQLCGQSKSGLQASDLVNMSESQVIDKIGPLCTEDEKRTGILACVTLAQFVLESGYIKLELAQNANNCFGMKTILSGNTWGGSTWDGKTKYTKTTSEWENGKFVSIVADFRKYNCVEDSIADHSAYLLGAQNGNKNRYDGLKGEKDYRKAAQIIKDGDYATDPEYVNKLCNIIERWNMTRFNVKSFSSGSASISTPKYYRVRKSWADAASQIGAYTVLDNAKAACKDGYAVFDWNGNVVYEASKSFLVKVTESALNIRSGPGINYKIVGCIRDRGVYTIVEEDGEWGLLTSYQKNRNGWINLYYTNRVNA